MNQALALRETYSKDDVVAYYAKYDELQKPEESILRHLGPGLWAMRMLDVGVGGGRITKHFAPRVREYHGIDLSPRMVELCRERFAGSIPRERFAVRDMRELDVYPARAFDLIFISYNTLDHLSPQERAAFLAAARRAIDPGGYLCFSSHNIACLARWISLGHWLGGNFWRHPRSGLRRLRQRARLLQLNREALAQQTSADCVVITNGTHDDFEMRSCYVRTEAQVRALNEAGFRSVRVYSLDTGAELRGAEIARAADRWLYYLAS